MRIFSVLLLSLLTLAVAVNAEVWYQMDVSGDNAKRAAIAAVRSVPTVDFRGIYGNVALFVGEAGIPEFSAVFSRNMDATFKEHEAPRPIRSTQGGGITLHLDFWILSREIPHPLSPAAQTNSRLQWTRDLAKIILEHPDVNTVASWPLQEQILITLPAGTPPPHWPAYMGAILLPKSRVQPASFRAQEVLPSEHPIFPLFSSEGLLPHEQDVFQASALVKDPTIQRFLDNIRAADIRQNIESLSRLQTRLATSPGGKEAENFLVRFLKENAPAFQVTSVPFDDRYTTPNVVARLEGQKHPEEVVILGCHYDSRSTDIEDPNMRAPGADDNGSNTANLLNFARLITQLRIQTQYSLELHFYGAEEQGLVGSRALAKQYATQGRKVVAMINADMIGYRIPGTPITLGMKDKSITDWLYSVTEAIAKLYVENLPVLPSASCCSDYMSWYENGYATVGLFESAGSASDNPHYHQSTDLPDTLDYEQVEKLARAFSAVGLTLAVPM